MNCCRSITIGTSYFKMIDAALNRVTTGIAISPSVAISATYGGTVAVAPIKSVVIGAVGCC